MDTTTTLTDAQQAAFLRDSSASVYLTSSVGACLGNVVTPTGFRLYLEELRQAAGNPTDPLQQMLWEQFAMAHHNLGRLYHQASGAKTIDEVQIYYAVTLKLHAELRQLGETLHRLSKSERSSAASSSKQPSMTADLPTDSGGRDTQQGSTESEGTDDRTIIPFTESQPRRRRSPKSVAASRTFG